MISTSERSADKFDFESIADKRLCDLCRCCRYSNCCVSVSVAVADLCFFFFLTCPHKRERGNSN
jgi:hypothetical protein